MRKLGYDEVRFDKMGNILGRIGSAQQPPAPVLGLRRSRVMAGGEKGGPPGPGMVEERAELQRESERHEDGGDE